ncbi:MAG TPA: hypothetical protein VIS72_06080 [Anaerolineales bacterium]
MKRRPIYLLGLAVLILSTLACSLLGGGSSEETVTVEESTSSREGSGSGEDGPVVSSEETPITEAGPCANTYYPVREGATWTYLDTSSLAEAVTFTDVISAVSEDGYTLTSQFDSLTRTQEWACTPEGLVALQLGGGLSTAGSNLIVETQSASGVTYPAEINAGDTWQYALDFTGTMVMAGETGEAVGSTQSNFTAIGVESVTIPAGTFDAMKVQVETTLDFIVTFQGSTVPINLTSSTTSWFVQNVGWVKSDSAGNFAGQSYTETIELQSYNIP